MSDSRQFSARSSLLFDMNDFDDEPEAEAIEIIDPTAARAKTAEATEETEQGSNVTTYIYLATLLVMLLMYATR